MSLFTEYYDTIWGDIADEKFLSDILAQYEKGLMVDLGCASGRVLKIGLKADWSVCGIDFDRDMLAEARKELDALPGCERSTLIESDFCDFNLPAPARVIVSMANTYTLVMDKEARRKLFKSVYRNLEKNGTFAVYFISSASFLTGVKERTFNVAGEMANQVLGKVKMNLGRMGIPAIIGLPMVVVGEKVIQHHASSPVLEVPFTDGGDIKGAIEFCLESRDVTVGNQESTEQTTKLVDMF